MLDVYAVLDGPGELCLTFRVIEDRRKTTARSAVLIVDRAYETFARTYAGISDVIGLEIPAGAAERSALVERLAAKMSAGGAQFFAYDKTKLLELSNGRGLAVSDPVAGAAARSLLGDRASGPFAVVIVEDGGITLSDHLCELAWALQRRGIRLVAASTGPVTQGAFWQSLPNLDPAVIAQLASRSAVAIGASTSMSYLIAAHAPMTCLYLSSGSRAADFAQATACVTVTSLADTSTRLPLGPLLQALGERSCDRACPDCGTTSGSFALTRNARWIVCERCPAVYPSPLAAA